MDRKICLSCRRLFQPRSQTPSQTYCSNRSCQRERRRLWQKLKRQFDPDYLDNQARAQQSWTERNSEYWREYRKRHPTYVAENRTKQRLRNTKNQSNPIAKMDASIPPGSLPSGIYRLIQIHDPKIAKMNSWTVELTLIEID